MIQRACTREGGRFFRFHRIFSDFVAENESKSEILLQMSDQNTPLKIQFKYIAPSVSLILFLRLFILTIYNENYIQL